MAADEIQALKAELRELQDIEAIKQLKARYVRNVDAQDWKAWADEVLTADFHFESDGGVQEGRDAAVAMVAEALRGQSTVHHVYTPEITITGADTARGTWAMEDWVRISRNGATMAFHGCGHYHEEYVRTAHGWRVKRAVLKRLRVDPIEGSAPLPARASAK